MAGDSVKSLIKFICQDVTPSTRTLFLTGEETFAQSLRVELRFNLLSQFVALHFSLLKILFDLGAVL